MRSIPTPLATLTAAAGFTLTAMAQDPPKVIDVDFMTEVKPLIEGACVHCHGPKEAEGEYRMDTKDATFLGGEAYGEDVIRPGDANDSPVYWMTTVHLDDPEDPEAMPPERPLNEKQQQILFSWIQNGAEWPEGVELVEKPRVTYEGVKPLLQRGGPFKRSELETLRYWVEQGADWPAGAVATEAPSGPADDLELVKKIRETILEQSKETTEAEMTDYANEIPKTGVKYEMVAIKGGEFTMGSPDSESARVDDEGPQRKVKIAPFWMGKFEVTWDMYEPFMITDVARNKDGSPQKIDPDAAPVDIVSSPTTPYQEMSFGMGTNGYPAICMTQHAALKFCQWLSAQTGHYYRLPTEAEWEYAARAGSETAYHFGEDPAQLGDFAVFDPDQTRTGYEKVGTKKPNPWGLYDMHGNVLEWCLDQYGDYDPADLDNPFARPTRLYPRVARGGSWYDTADYLRSAARTASDANWKQQDPQLPKSIWYHTDATWLGFRLVRPLEVPEAETIHDIWSQGARDEEE